MTDEPLPIVLPQEAIAYFKAKGFQIAFDWRDVWQEENAKAFTVAKAMSRDLLEDIREAVQSAIDEGTTLQQFVKELRPRLVKRGWWGRKLMVDPADGPDAVAKVVQLGSPARLRTIYQTNLRTSYMAGRWQRIQRSKRAFPLLRYISVKDGREREEHGRWHDTILPVDHPWWDTHFPPCGWNCRCDAQPLNQRMLARRDWAVTGEDDIVRFPQRDYVNKRTGEVTRVEQGIDPGFSYNVGKASLDGLAPAPRTGSDPEDGVTSELNAALSDASFEPLRGFFAAFGIADRDAAITGMIHRDVAGWPMVVSAGLFRSAEGRMVDLSPAKVQLLPGAAQTLTDPDRIGWLWIAGRDGRAMLVRRYFGPNGVVDMGGRFWRWMAAGGGAYAHGRVVWTRGDGDLV